jgi:hypothetical protein
MNRLKYGTDDFFNEMILEEIDETVFQYMKLREEGASGDELYEPLKQLADYSSQITGYKHSLIQHFSRVERESTIRRIMAVGDGDEDLYFDPI